MLNHYFPFHRQTVRNIYGVFCKGFKVHLRGKDVLATPIGDIEKSQIPFLFYFRRLFYIKKKENLAISSKVILVHDDVNRTYHPLFPKVVPRIGVFKTGPSFPCYTPAPKSTSDRSKFQMLVSTSLTNAYLTPARHLKISYLVRKI